MAAQQKRPKAHETTAEEFRGDSDQLTNGDAKTLRETDADHARATSAAAGEEVDEIDEVLADAEKARHDLEDLLDEIDAEIERGDTFFTERYVQKGGE